MLTIITFFLYSLTAYFLIGILFGFYFIFKASKIDPLLENSKWTVRLLLLPGTIVTWPFFILSLFKSKK